MRLVRMRKMRLGGLSVAMACLASVSMTAQSPYGWRGPERDGVYFENGLLKEWPSEGPELLWETMELGNPASELIVIAGIAIEKGMKSDELKSFVFPHPTVGEIIKEALY